MAIGLGLDCVGHVVNAVLAVVAPAQAADGGEFSDDHVLLAGGNDREGVGSCDGGALPPPGLGDGRFVAHHSRSRLGFRYSISVEVGPQRRVGTQARCSPG